MDGGLFGVRAIWIWGLSLIALTIIIHAMGLSLATFMLRSIRVRLESASLSLRHGYWIFIRTIGGVGLLLAVLHGIEAGFWAEAYLWLGAVDSPEAAILYSVDSMSTRGASGQVLQQNWQLMGALEAFNGMLLFGLSTAFIFAVMQVYWPLVTNRRNPP
jgi:hypothetical protein